MSIKEVVKFLALFIWQLPQNIIAIFILPFIGKLTKIQYKNSCFCFVGEKMKGGISLGSFIFLSNYYKNDMFVIKHEYGHVVDSHRFGPLYLLIIGLPSLIWAMIYDPRKEKYKNISYYDFFTEKRANNN